MKTITNWLNNSLYLEPLSPGCKQCAQGKKLVLLVTGKCSSTCFYCPLSKQKIGQDVIYADEWKLHNEQDLSTILKEAQFINAAGAGITGGDPLLVWKRTTQYIKILKQQFGPQFHIHLYTSGLINQNHVFDFAKAGLDEIRFHPPPTMWHTMQSSTIHQAIRKAQQTNMKIAIEIPVLPDKKTEILTLIKWANTTHIDWINLNELEFSETNTKQLLLHNYHTKEESAAVGGSQETAEKIVQSVQKKQYQIGVHYCSVSFKDGVQLRNRIRRRAQNTARPFDVITHEGTILFGIIQSDTQTLEEILSFIQKKIPDQSELYIINHQKKRIELAGWLLEDLLPDLKKKKLSYYLVEEYPTADHLQIERIPL